MAAHNRYEGKVSTAHHAKATESDFEPKVKNSEIDNLQTIDDFKTSTATTTAHVQKSLEKKAEVEQLKNQNIMDAAYKLIEEQEEIDRASLPNNGTL